jgi:hypothetical protein
MPLDGNLLGETVTVPITVVGITTYRPPKGGSTPTFKVGAADLLLNSGGPIRYRKDGGAPTATVGNLVSAGTKIELRGWAEVRDFQAIRDTSAVADGILQVTPAIGYHP